MLHALLCVSEAGADRQGSEPDFINGATLL
jgi:hypothetical protein